MYFTPQLSVVNQEQVAVIYDLSIWLVLYYLVANSDFLTGFSTKRTHAGAECDLMQRGPCSSRDFNQSAAA